jgi:trigger factor
MIPKAYEEAIVSQAIEAIDKPEIEIVQKEPVIFKAIVPIKPTVRLGDYKKIKIQSNPKEVNDQDVEATIEQLQHQHATFVPVERAVTYGDLVTMDVDGKREGQSFPIGKDVVYDVREDSRLPLPGFAANLLEMDREEEKNFVLTYPEDYENPELAGKNYEFKVLITEVKEKVLPELNDDFAKGLGFEGLSLLREQITMSLKQRADDRARLDLEQKTIDTIVGSSEIDYPPILIDRAIDRLLSEEAENFQDGFDGLERYLQSINKTLEGHRDELKPIATGRVVRTLVLERIADEEDIDVDESEVDVEIDKMAKGSGEQSEEVRRLLNLSRSRDSVKGYIKNRKAMEKLIKMVTGNI